MTTNPMQRLTPLNNTLHALTFNLIGAGRLGKALAYALTQHGATLKGVCNRSRSSAEAAVFALEQGSAYALISELPEAELTVIAVPDEVISSVAKALSEKKDLRSRRIVMHMSGVLSSQVLHPLPEKGVFTASAHPMQSFTNSTLNANAFQGCGVTLEGHPEALAVLNPLFDAIGARTATIEARHKALYHAAAVLSCNYTVTLQAIAMQWLKASGIDDAMAKHMIEHLLQSTLTNIQHKPTLEQALTGPLARGDGQTIQAHLNALTGLDEKALYQQLGLHTLPLTSLKDTLKARLKEMLLGG